MLARRSKHVLGTVPKAAQEVRLGWCLAARLLGHAIKCLVLGLLVVNLALSQASSVCLVQLCWCHSIGLSFGSPHKSYRSHIAIWL